jgi:hypothetical protein
VSDKERGTSFIKAAERSFFAEIEKPEDAEAMKKAGGGLLDGWKH